MRIDLGIAGLTLALATGLALAPRPAPKPNATLGRCYRLRLGIWGTMANPGPESMPLFIRFDTIGSSAGATAQGLLRPTINMDMHNAGTWETFADDSVRFGWTAERGFSAIQIRAKIMDDSLVGVVSGSQFDRTSAIAPAAAYRITCPKHLR